MPPFPEAGAGGAIAGGAITAAQRLAALRGLQMNLGARGLEGIAPQFLQNLAGEQLGLSPEMLTGEMSTLFPGR